MQPLKLVIEGSFWDCQIYRGRLYLFDREGAINVVDWDSLLEKVQVPTRLDLAKVCGFTQGDYLYGDRWQLLFRDPDIRRALTSKFLQLAKKDLTVSAPLLGRCTLHKKLSPFPFPHIDSTIYINTMYIAAQAGVFGGSVGPRLKYGVNTRPTKIWDCAATGISASYETLALAAGSEGLYQHESSSRYSLSTHSSDPKQLSNHHCSQCDWMYYSIYGSSLISGGYLAEFSRDDPASYDVFDDRRRVDQGDSRVFVGVKSRSDIFHHGGYSWGAKDKVYQYAARTLRIKRYAPWAKSPDERLLSLGSIDIMPSKGEFIGAKVAVFGIILEFENALVVVPSDGDPHTIWGEPVAWRVYPRSRRYENHLHVVMEDAIEIYSFNQDYFVDQDSKKLGSCYRSK